MIGTRTPYRISFAGGGTDLPNFYSRHYGCVVSTSINKYMYILVHPLFSDKIQVKYSKTELVEKIKDIEHPIARAVLSKFGNSGIDINSIGDMPAGTGLGSSSSFTVGLLHALYGYNNTYISAERLAKDACKIEIELLEEPIGKQDQYAAAYGGLNFIKFRKDGEVDIEPILMKSEKLKELESNLLMFYTGKRRKASNILHEQNKNMSHDDKFRTMVKMVDLGEKMKQALVDSDLEAFGSILDDNWHLKKSLVNQISDSDIDKIYDCARDAGATGGKLLGAGGGGFLLFYCPASHHRNLREKMSSLKELEFKFDRTGSKIIYVGDTNAHDRKL